MPTDLRTAIVRATPDTVQDTVYRVAAYLPANYTASILDIDTDTCAVVIYGVDRAGWTLDGYVIPRLASGLIFAETVA
jgi:hypothetical protein